MTLLLLALALAALTPAPPAAGVVLEQGDVLYIHNDALVHFDPRTGVRQVISGCADPPGYECVGNPGAVVGTGPMWQGSYYSTPLAQPGGSALLFTTESAPPNAVVVFRIDPSNGNRTIVARANDGNGVPLLFGATR